MAEPALNLDLDEQIARIRRHQVESDKLQAESHKLLSEQLKLQAEQLKLSMEAAKLARDRSLAPWQIVLTLLGAGGALFGAGAAFVKLFGP